MADNDANLREALWKMFEWETAQFRHHENERSAVASAVTGISAAMVAIVTFDDSIAAPADIPTALLLVALGVFGAIFSMKQYERSQFHYQRLQNVRGELESLLSDCPLQQLRDAAETNHKAKFPVLWGLRLHDLWLALHLVVSVVGVFLLVVAWWFPVLPKSGP
jgi:hypothetical protein